MIHCFYVQADLCLTYRGHRHALQSHKDAHRGHKIGAFRGRVVHKWYFGHKIGRFCGRGMKIPDYPKLLSNASAESLNSKVKAFRSQFRSVRDIAFFIFRLAKIFA